MPPGLAFPSGIELFTTLRDSPDEGRNYSAIARLRRGATLAAARADISAVAAQTAVERPEANAQWGATVVPLTEQIVGPVRLPLLVLLAAVGFVLLIACANVANLLLMRSAERSREMSIRRALGAGRFRLLHQVLVEGLLLASIGGLCGLTLAHWGVRALVLTLPATIPLPRLQEIGVDASVLIFITAVSLGAGVLASLAPALQANRADMARELHQSGRSVTATQRRVRAAMVVAEVALALPLLGGAGLMVRSFLRLNAVEPGFRVEGVLTARMLLLPVRERAYHAQFVDQVLQRIRAVPQVLAAGSIGILPMTGTNSGSWYYRADQPEPPRSERPAGDISIVSTGYLQAMGIPLLKGRDFDERDHIGSQHVAMLNATAARRLFANEEPLGRRLRVSWRDAREVEIVGVVGDIRHSQLQAKPEPCLFLPNDQQPFPLSSLVVRTAGNPLALVALVKEQVRQVDSDQGIAEIQTLEELVASAMARPRVQTALGGLLSIVALILAVVGIYGVIAQSVGQRTREIGIRFALGASRRSIFAVVLHEGLSLTAVGLVIGVGASVGLTRYLQGLLFEVEPLDPIVFATVNTLVLLVAAAACTAPAARAARVDPAVVLKQECSLLGRMSQSTEFRRRVVILSPVGLIVACHLVQRAAGGALGVWAWVPTMTVFWATIAGLIAWARGRQALGRWLQAPQGGWIWSVVAAAVGLVSVREFLADWHVLESPTVFSFWLGFGLINPWFEESYWRGLLIDATATWPGGLGLVYSTVLFALSRPLIWGVHSLAFRHPAALVGLAFVGAVWSVAYHRTGTLRWTIAGHALANLLGLSVPMLLNLHIPAALR